MKEIRTAICLLLSFSLTATSAHALPLNTTAISLCESGFYSCVEKSGTINSSGAFSNCTAPFEDCISTTAFPASQKSQDCYLAESAWKNLQISFAFATIIFFGSTIVLPIILKVMAKKITKWSKYDPEEHPCLGCLGPRLLYMTDSDGDGKVTASEIVTPQTIFSFSSVAIPAYQWFTANDQQAKCDYQESLVPSH